MTSNKQSIEFSKLLKNNEKPKIIHNDLTYRKLNQNDFLIKCIYKINENFILLFLSMILILLIIIYILLASIKSNQKLVNNNKFNTIYNDKQIYEEKIIKKYKKLNLTNIYNETKMCSENKEFAILSRINCQACGLFSYYIVHLGCIITYLNEGYIPIIDVSSYLNVFNGFNESLIDKENRWEKFFYQPCGYTLNEVKLKNNINYFMCECSDNMPSEKEVYSNKTLLKHFRYIANQYMSVKKEIIDEADIIWEKLFKDSKNVLGLLVRGTDYISIKPSFHSIPPTADMVIKDAIKMNFENKYDFIFLATEDNKIRQKFIKEFGNKLKYLLPEKIIKYNYDEGNYLSMYDDSFGNMKFQKTYLLSMIILSKCLDIISSRTSGAAGAYILSKGFRNDFVYYIGEYPEYYR